MNYAFKMMAVMLALGMLVLGVGVKDVFAAKISNCSNCSKFHKITNEKLCQIMVSIKTKWVNLKYKNHRDIYPSENYFSWFKKQKVYSSKSNYFYAAEYEKEYVHRGLQCADYSSIYEKYNNAENVSNPKTKNTANRPLASVSDSTVCYNATKKSGNTKIWNTKNDNFVGEANYRGLDCGVKDDNKTVKSKLYKGLFNNEDICDKASTLEGTWANHSDLFEFVKEAKRRDLDCGDVNVANADKGKDWYNKSLDFALKGDFSKSEKSFKEFIKTYRGHEKHADAQYWLGRVYFIQKKYKEAAIALAEFNRFFPNDKRLQHTTLLIAESAINFAPKEQLCDILNQSLEFIINPSLKFVQRINFLKKQKNCNDNNSNQNVIASKPKTKTYIKAKPTISSTELEASKREAETERQRRIELESKLAALENKQKQEQQRVDTDIRVPSLEIISNKTMGKRGTITGIARDNIEVAEVTVDGKSVSLSSNGNFNYSTYVPQTGLELNIQVTDVAGLTSSKTVILKADTLIADSSISFDRLNPLG